VIDRSPAWESADPNGCYGNAPSYGWLRKKRTGQILRAKFAVRGTSPAWPPASTRSCFGRRHGRARTCASLVVSRTQ